MIAIASRRRVTARPNPGRAARPALEGLEGRVLLSSTTGGLWTRPARVTYSLVPDGTDVGGTPSSLQRVLATKAGWQQQIQRAAAAWEAVAGINLVQVPDDGSRIGAAGDQQGDPRFGDIRIGGMPQPGGQLAFAYAPPPFNGATAAGDIFFNTSQSWQTGGATYDLMTVAIHEFGHALGMGHSAVTAAAMYAGYTSSRQALASDDAQGFQSIYGSRRPDAFDAAAGNNSSKAATVVTSYLDGSGQVALANLDVTSGSDVDWFKVTVPAATAGTMTVSMQATGLSSLVPGLTVYDANLRAPGDATVANAGGTITVTTPGVRAGQVWYVKAMAGATGPAGIGAYGLLVNFGSGGQAAVAPPDTRVAAQPDTNPVTTAMGEGWVVKGRFIPLHQGDAGHDGNDNGLRRVTTGELGGWGDALEVGGLHARDQVIGGVRLASGSSHLGVPDRSSVPPARDLMTAVPVTPLAASIGAGSGRVRAAARSPHRVPSNRAESARHRVLDAALAGSGTNGLLSRTRPPSRPVEVGHPCVPRTIAELGPET